MKKNQSISPIVTSIEPNGPNSIKIVLTVEQFAKRYNNSRVSGYRWVKAGLPHLKLGPRNTQIPISEGDRWMKENFFRQREV